MAVPTCFALRIALLCGGDSEEREVSLCSGEQVYQALRTAGHLVQKFDPAETPLEQIPWEQFDGCFIALHGGAGEDGRVQQKLERLGVAYTGSGPNASALAMDKWASQQSFDAMGLLTPESLLVQFRDEKAVPSFLTTANKVTLDTIDRLGFPMVVKPNRQGSSLGVGIAQNHNELIENLTQAAKFDSSLLIQRFIAGRELTVSVINGHPLPVLEILPPDGRYDYEAKYHSSQTGYRFDLKLPEAVLAKIQQTAIDAAEVLGTSGLVRVDLILNEGHDEGHCAWVLEVNTIPGMTLTSLSPKAAQHAGIDMPQLCDRLVRQFQRAEKVA